MGLRPRAREARAWSPAIRPGKKAEFFVLYFTKSCQQIWVRVNQPFMPWYITYEVKQYYEALFLIILQSSGRMQYFTILQYKLHSFNIQDDRSMRGLLAKPLKKFPKSPIRPSGSHFCSLSGGRVFEWTLIELRSNIIKNLLCLSFV